MENTKWPTSRSLNGLVEESETYAQFTEARRRAHEAVDSGKFDALRQAPTWVDFVIKEYRQNFYRPFMAIDPTSPNAPRAVRNITANLLLRVLDLAVIDLAHNFGRNNEQPIGVFEMRGNLLQDIAEDLVEGARDAILDAADQQENREVKRRARDVVERSRRAMAKWIEEQDGRDRAGASSADFRQ